MARPVIFLEEHIITTTSGAFSAMRDDFAAAAKGVLGPSAMQRFHGNIDDVAFEVQIAILAQDKVRPWSKVFSPEPRVVFLTVQRCRWILVASA